MIRLFTAISVPDETVQELSGVTMDIQGVHWVANNQYHITLTFIGDVNVWMYRQIKTQLGMIIPEAFSIRGQGLDVFHNSQNQPHVLYAKVDVTEALQTLRDEIQDILFSMGVDCDTRAFVPHISLARLRPNADMNSVNTLIQNYQEKSLKEFSVDNFALFSSRLSQKGAIHTQVASYHTVSHYQDVL